MDVLTREQKAELKQRLLTRERELHADAQRENGKLESYERLAGEAPDNGDASVADTIIDTTQAAIGRDLDELRAIATALQRLDEPDYGLCIDCGVPIPLARLEAQPTAQRCLRCQALYEHNHAGIAAGIGRPPSL